MKLLTKFTAAEEFKRTVGIIKEYGFESKPRDQKVRETFYEMLCINPLYPVPDFIERPFNFKYFCGEMSWYLSKETTLDKIKPFSSFWNNITNTDGTVNSNYGNLLFGKQLRWVYDSLVKDKDSRQAIAFINQPKFQYVGNKDFVCTMYLNFSIRDNKLDMKMTIRSNDLIFGFSYDVPFFSFILQDMYLWLKETKYPDLELGTYYHFADNIHYYQRHFDVVDKIMQTDNEKNQPSLILIKRFFNINSDGDYELTQDGANFCKNTDRLAETFATHELYVKELQQFFQIS